MSKAVVPWTVSVLLISCLCQVSNIVACLQGSRYHSKALWCFMNGPTNMAACPPVQVAIPGNPPIMFSSLDQLLAASTVQCSHTGLLNALRMVVSLRDSVLEASPRLAGLTPTRLCGLLLLYNSSLSRLCLALQCPELLQLTVQLPPEACPQLRCIHYCA